MPKSRKRKKTAGRVSGGSVAVQERAVSEAQIGTSKPVNWQNLAYSLMVALGFWGLAIFCTFFYVADPNHYLYGAIMGLTAAGWTVIVVRRWLVSRPRV